MIIQRERYVGKASLVFIFAFRMIQPIFRKFRNRFGTVRPSDFSLINISGCVFVQMLLSNHADTMELKGINPIKLTLSLSRQSLRYIP